MSCAEPIRPFKKSSKPDCGDHKKGVENPVCTSTRTSAVPTTTPLSLMAAGMLHTVPASVPISRIVIR
jgi:hypothetical protein